MQKYIQFFRADKSEPCGSDYCRPVDGRYNLSSIDYVANNHKARFAKNFPATCADMFYYRVGIGSVLDERYITNFIKTL